MTDHTPDLGSHEHLDEALLREAIDFQPAQPPVMSLEDFFTALYACATRYQWRLEDTSAIRGVRVLDTDVDGATFVGVFSTITAVAYSQHSLLYDYRMQWDNAAEVLGLSLADASLITQAEDGQPGLTSEVAALRGRLLRTVHLIACFY